MRLQVHPCPRLLATFSIWKEKKWNFIFVCSEARDETGVGGVVASDACPFSCDNCGITPQPTFLRVPQPTSTCADSESWYYKKQKRTCAAYVAENTKRCSKTGADGVKAEVACAQTCGAC